MALKMLWNNPITAQTEKQTIYIQIYLTEIGVHMDVELSPIIIDKLLLKITIY